MYSAIGQFFTHLLKAILIPFCFIDFACYGYDIAKPKVAICYWGLTRSTKKVYESHFKNLFDVLDEHEIAYDVFMHTWRTKSKQRVGDQEIENAIDYGEYKF